MPCHEFIKLKVDDYLRDELSADDKSRFEDILESSPKDREFVNDQKAAFGFVRSGEAYQNDDQYWNLLENAIVNSINAREPISKLPSRAEESHNRNIWNTLIPLAACFLIFVAAISFSNLAEIDPSKGFAAMHSDNSVDKTSYLELIETREIIAISHMTTPAPGLMGY